jgi:hypothetical protein
MDLVGSRDRGQQLQWMENPLRGPGRAPGKVPWRIWTIEPKGQGFFDPDEVHMSYRGSDNRLHHELDLNRDGRPDIVNFKYGGEVQYIPGPKDTRTQNGAWKYFTIGNAGGTGALGDLDADGDVDLATRDAWYENTGDPSSSPWPKHGYQDQGPSGKVVVVDIDGDRRLDVVVSSEEETDGITWYRNPGDDAKGQWAATQLITPDAAWKGLHSLRAADFDGDGDMYVCTAEMHGRAEQRVAICENVDGKGKSWAIHVVSRSGCHNAKVADLNGDGAPDIVGKNYEKDIRPRIWINPHGPFQSAAIRAARPVTR